MLQQLQEVTIAINTIISKGFLLMVFYCTVCEYTPDYLQYKLVQQTTCSATGTGYRYLYRTRNVLIIIYYYRYVRVPQVLTGTQY